MTIPITHAVKVKAILLSELDPIKEVKTSEFDNFSQLDLEDDTHFFIDEEEDDPIDADELLEPLKPPIEVKHYLLDLTMFFSIMIKNIL